MRPTGEVALDLHDLPFVLILEGKGGVQVKGLLCDVEEVAAPTVEELFATAHRCQLGLDAHPWGAVEVFDVEVVKQLFLDDQCLGLARRCVVKNGQWLRQWRELVCCHPVQVM